MCTLIALHRCVPEFPLVVAANRDEYLDRPSEGPRLRAGRSGAFVSPLDLKEGGTWMGVNRAGVFAGVTNRRGAPRDPGRRSRGLLVLGALEAGSAAEAAEALAALPPGAHNPFNLLLADGRDAFLATAADGSPRVSRLSPGVHVVGNVDPEAAAPGKLLRLRAEAERAAAAGPQGVLAALADLCRAHRGAEDPLDETCIHTPVYGTRSSSLLHLGGAREALFFAEGPPCRNPYGDHSALLRELRGERAIAGAA